MTQHLSDTQLLDTIYGIAAAGPHLEACPDCQARLAQMQQRRKQTVAPTPSAAFFHSQRRNVLARIAEPRLRYGWLPATAAAVLMIGLAITRTAPQPAAPEPRATAVLVEAGWFEETYSATRALEPRAASPIRELFEQGPVLE